MALYHQSNNSPLYGHQGRESRVILAIIGIGKRIQGTWFKLGFVGWPVIESSSAEMSRVVIDL